MTLDLHASGAGYLRVEMSAGLSAAVSVQANSPLKILVPKARGLSVWAFLSSLGGGLVAGDQISIAVQLGEQARCWLGTQAWTKVYRNPNGMPCSQRLEAHLARGSLLALVPDPVQAFLGSQYYQQQKFFLAPESGLVLVDWLCSGRVARGERWAFSRFRSRNEVVFPEARVLMDSLVLDPNDGPLAEPYRLGRFNCLAMVLLVGEPLQGAASSLLEEFAALPVSRRAAVVSSASPVHHGVLLRLAGQEPERVAAEIHKHLAFVREFIGEVPWLRKY